MTQNQNNSAGASGDMDSPAPAQLKIACDALREIASSQMQALRLIANEALGAIEQLGHMAPSRHAATSADAPYRVAEFWSSANPDKKVRMLAEGDAITQWGKRSDFIRWLDQPAAQAASLPSSPDMAMPRVPDTFSQSAYALLEHIATSLFNGLDYNVSQRAARAKISTIMRQAMSDEIGKALLCDLYDEKQTGVGPVAAQPAKRCDHEAVARVVGSDTVIGRERRSLEWQKDVQPFRFQPGTVLYAFAAPERSDTPAHLVEGLKRIKGHLMHARRFGPDTLRAFQQACGNAECEIEELLARKQGAQGDA